MKITVNQKTRCNFCMKDRKEIEFMIEAATGAIICNECLIQSLQKMISYVRTKKADPK